MGHYDRRIALSIHRSGPLVGNEVRESGQKTQIQTEFSVFRKTTSHLCMNSPMASVRVALVSKSKEVCRDKAHQSRGGNRNRVQPKLSEEIPVPHEGVVNFSPLTSSFLRWPESPNVNIDPRRTRHMAASTKLPVVFWFILPW